MFFSTPLNRVTSNIGTGDQDPANPYTNLGGINISYLPLITVCSKDPQTGKPTSNCKTTTDLGQPLVDGSSDHVGKIKDPSCAVSQPVRPTFTMVPLRPYSMPSSSMKSAST